MQLPNRIGQQSVSLRTSISFVVLATLTIVLIGYLSSVDLLPISKTVEFGDRGSQFIRGWLKLAIAIGLILPAIAFAIGFQRPEPRRIFGFYLLLLIIQIITEQVLSQNWMSSLVVPTGTLYTAFRIWQSWQGLQLIQSARKHLSRYIFFRGVLWMALCFWLCNLVMLLTIG